MYTYTAYGLNIRSVLSLPELAEGKQTSVGKKPEVLVRIEKISNVPIEVNGATRCIYPTNDGVYLYWPGIGSFLVRGGREIIIDPAPSVEEPVLRLYTLSLPLATLLQQRGYLAVLHASAAVIAGQAVAFVGPKGAGKSTLAAILHVEGYNILADDILAIDLSLGHPLALPGFPHVKLWPETIALLGHSPEALPRLRSGLEKRSYRLNYGFSQLSTPLKGICILSSGPELEIEPLSPQQALFELMPHWYGARFGLTLLQALGVTTHFRQCAALANEVAICRLRSPRSLERLQGVGQLLEAHLVSLPSVNDRVKR